MGGVVWVAYQGFQVREACVHVLIPGNYEYFTLWGKSDFAHMLIDFEIRRLSCINWVAPNIVITRVFVKKEAGRSESDKM